MQNEVFVSQPGFCANCGTILPLLGDRPSVTCYTCAQEYPISHFNDAKVEYTIHFHSVEEYAKSLEDEKKRKKIHGDEGPVVDRTCPKCGNDKMSYATLQLRSADEGQTVFYTCNKCKYKESENS